MSNNSDDIKRIRRRLGGIEAAIWLLIAGKCLKGLLEMLTWVGTA